MKKDTKQDIKDITDGCLLVRYSGLFHKFLINLSPSTRDIIKNNKELNDLFDLMLDFTIDASQHIDYKQAISSTKELPTF